MVQLNHIAKLDYLRGVAILSVFLYHSLGASFGHCQFPWNGLWRDFTTSRSFYPFYPLTLGSLGVSLFFVISGFCIHLSFLTSREKGFYAFFVRRFFRIYPTYIVVLAATLVLRQLQNALGVTSDLDVSYQNIISHAILCHNFTTDYFFGINPSLWSIAVEMQLYALYPILFLLLKYLGSWDRVVCFTVILEVVLRAIMAYDSVQGSSSEIQRLVQWPFTYWGSWALGTKVAQDMFMKTSPSTDSNIFDSKWISYFLILSVVLCDWFRPASYFQFLFFAMLAYLWLRRLVWSNALDKTSQDKASWFYKRMSLMGVVSYSFYLIHQPILDFLWLLPGHPVYRLSLAVVLLPVVVAISYFTYKAIELPTNSWGKNYTRSKQPL